MLVIDDNPGDTRLILEALTEVGVVDGVCCMPDGDEALTYLRRQGKHSAASLPHLIFLDLVLPRKPGLVVLTEIKSNPELKVIPVIILSGSHEPKQIREAYELHASCVIYKPEELSEFMRFIQTCYEFWGSVVTLPPLS